MLVEAAAREVKSSIRLHQLLMVFALLMPAGLFTAVAWQNYEDVLREGRNSIERTTAVMQEHARKVFETAELAIGQVDEHIDGRTWEQVGSPLTSDFLRRLKSPMDQVVSIWVADADGLVRAGSEAWPPGSGIGVGDFFQAARDGDGGTYISEVFRGMVTGIGSFAIIRRRMTLDGRFDGTIHLAGSPEYFARFYAEASPPVPHVALLLRGDGSVLAREPAYASAPMRFAPEGPLMQRVHAWSGDGGLVHEGGGKGAGATAAIRKVGSYPLFVVFAVPDAVLLARWHRNLTVYGAVAAGAALTLLVVSWLALRRARSEQAALVQLRTESRQRQAAELQLRHAQRMDAVGQLTGGVAHDFNNLLTAILGNLELIQRAAKAANGQDRVIRLALTAIKAVQRGSSLTKSLLAFSRKQPLQARPIDANATLADFLDLVRQAVGVGIAVQFTPEGGLPACVADPAELEAAVLNLSINARDAMPDGGYLTIGTRAAALGTAALEGNPEARPGHFIAISVADSGVGMSEDVAAKAFEPFFTTKPIGQGTGLGLSRVFGFARQLGGHVTIESTPDIGTAITLFLPVA